MKKKKKYLFLDNMIHGEFVKVGLECEITSNAKDQAEVHFVITSRGRYKGRKGYVVQTGLFAEATSYNKSLLNSSLLRVKRLKKLEKEANKIWRSIKRPAYGSL